MTDIPSLCESVPMDHVIDRTASEGVQLAQAEGWIRQLMTSYQSIQQTCANKDAVIVSLRAELAEERRKVEVATPFLRQLSTANLTKDNCASFDVANKRIRNLATQALAALTSTGKADGE